MIDWQPAATAPKDGTWILGINNRGNCAVIIWSEMALVRKGHEYGCMPGWVHPFTTLERSEFWNGTCGSVMVAWAALPRGEDAQGVVEKFEPMLRVAEGGRR